LMKPAGMAMLRVAMPARAGADGVDGCGRCGRARRGAHGCGRARTGINPRAKCRDAG
jgi:hypothetical protein